MGQGAGRKRESAGRFKPFKPFNLSPRLIRLGRSFSRSVQAENCLNGLNGLNHYNPPSRAYSQRGQLSGTDFASIGQPHS